jgi:hypothetical protein
MTTPPKDGEKQPKTHDGKQWWWCKKHNKWCRHTTAQCKGQNLGGHKPTDDVSDKDKPKHSATEAKEPKLIRALQAA